MKPRNMLIVAYLLFGFGTALGEREERKKAMFVMEYAVITAIWPLLTLMNLAEKKI